MSTTIQKVLGAKNLLGSVDLVLAGLPQNVLPPGLLGGTTTRPVSGNTGTYIRSEGTQKTAKHVAYGGASRPRTISGISEQPVILLSPRENIGLKFTDLANLNSPDGTRQRMGEWEVARQVREATQYLQNLRTASVFSLFGLGHIYIGPDGDLLHSSSGAVIDIDPGIRTGTAAVTWATNTTDIIGDFISINAQAVQYTGRPFRHAIYGSNILKYLLNNDKTKELINRSPAGQDAAMQSLIPNGFAGLQWWPGYDAFYRDDSGTVRTLVGADDIIFMPEVSTDWFEFCEGTNPVPTAGFGAAADMSDLIANAEMRQGIYTYAYGQMDPLGGTMIYGDTFLPVIKVPNAVLKFDTTT